MILITGDPLSVENVIANNALAALKPYDFDILGRVITDTLRRPSLS
ncbi:MAG: hypothetical protein ABI812_07505 [Betaproteobacteria bacterium]